MNVLANDIKKHLATIDWFLVITVFLAMVYGFILIKSATNVVPYLNPPQNQLRMIIVHVTAAIIGIAGMFILSKLDYGQLVKYSRYLYIFGVLLLVFTLIFGVGDEVGNRSWLYIPGIPVGIQPSEFVKIAFILILANLLDKFKENLNHIKIILLVILPFAIIFGLILAAGDLGNNLVYAFIFVAMCFAAGVSLWYFLAGIFIFVASSPIWWNLMPYYRQMRIIAGFDPSVDPDEFGFQALRSMRAIGSGGLYGAGYQKGYMTQRGLVPKQWTDFIYSAAGEEFGFIGAMLVLILLTVIIARIFIISRKARNTSGSLICVGVMSIFIGQTVENVGMCLGKLPVIGITLPFFSYGGSSILSSLLAIGLVLSVNSRKNIYYFTRDENLDRF
ncbi:MAG: FtsW/RodA/SpoVE family cell cycle protein [Oscillospiraceae bacterium]|nr:FtsW/RodA/SpoVE family cell cycle protein [Oscillospiraceae bacterium]